MKSCGLLDQFPDASYRQDNPIELYKNTIYKLLKSTAITILQRLILFPIGCLERLNYAGPKGSLKPCIFVT